ncbi:hypothetical protein GCM10009839_00760 [Catenulispora yoronensis]|uniref:PKD domain-containing protein n=1 Tax=Catenulispora yoronensis TaxID=450799 RepID=A0ABP5EWZ2_9ACTN
MRSRPIVFGAVCAVVASFDVAAPGLAHAASVIHVRQVSGCSDTAANAGSDAVPYCSISAAVSVVQPGQEVEVGEGTYKESVTVSRSGTPQAPIVIAAEPDTLVYLQNFIDNAHSGPVPLKLDHVHDVTVRGLRVQGSEQDAVLVDGSSDVVLDHLFASGGDSTSSVEVTGGSSNVTLSRSNLGGYEAPAVLVHGGSRDTTITTNNLGLGQDGIVVDGATGTVVTSNTVWKLKGSSVVLKNGATGSTVENNVLIPPRTAKPATDTPVFSVDAASAPNTVADYNTVQAGAGYAAYSWAGAVQHTQETFTQASGQGTHDIVQIGDEQNGGWPSYLAVEGDSRIDSANVAAPGELPSDIDGVTALDDPRVRNTGTGSGYRDRGAYEFKDPLASGDISLVPAAAPIGVPVTIKVNPSVGWSKNLTYTFTFDDDNPTTVSGPDSTVQHTFTTVGRRTVRYRVTDDLGAETPWLGVYFEAGTPGDPLVPVLSTSSLGVEYDYRGRPAVRIVVGMYPSRDPWEITQAYVDFGDGTPEQGPISVDANQDLDQDHLYYASGTYTVKLTLTDYIGRTASTTQKVTVTVPTLPATQATVHRIGGGDRYDTARLVSQAQWKDGAASAVVLARGDQAPDALAGVPFAARMEGPLLLTDPKSLDQETKAEIARVTGGPSADKTVYILGGDSAVSPSVESGLRAAGYHVVRYQGADRFKTALAVASAFGNSWRVIVATGQDFPDAVAAGPLGARESAPIVLSDGNALDPATAAFILAHQEIEPVGGFAQRAVATLNTTGRTVDQTLSGPTRYDTAVAVANALIQLTGQAPTGVGIASGQMFPDALTGGTYAAHLGIPLLLTEPTALPPATRIPLTGWANSLATVTVFGGDKAVTGAVVDAVAAAVKGTVK